MGKLLYVGTYGTDDVTRATMPFLGASGALDAGHEPSVVLMGEAVYLMKDEITDSVDGVGLPQLRQLFDKIVGAKVPIHV